jgi:hypothetical protein
MKLQMKTITPTTFMIFALLLVGCSQLKTVYDTVTSAKVPAKVVYVAVNAFDAAKITAKNYIVYCTPNPSPKGCDDGAIKTKLDPAIKSGTAARDSLQDFLAEHPGELGNKGLYDAMTAATNTIKDVTANFKE